jgi:DNA-binding beta-propeller fold protein YncE
MHRVTVAVWLAVVVAGATTMPEAHASVPTVPTGPASATTVYVAVRTTDSVVPIDAATKVAGTALPAGSWPIADAITPDGTTLYAADQMGGAVTPIDLTTGVTGTPIDVGAGSEPQFIAIAPNGKLAYASLAENGRIIPIDLTTNTAGSSFYVGGQAIGLVFTPDSRTLYVSAGGAVTPVDTATNTLGTPIRLSNSVSFGAGLAITPDGSTVWAVDEPNGALVPIDVATNTAGTPVALHGDDVFSVVITPNGKRAYVVDENGHEIIPVNLVTRRAGRPIALGADVIDLAVTPDGSTLWVSGQTTAIPVDVKTRAVGAGVSVGSDPWGVAITPDQAPIAAFSASPAPVGSPTGFDASASAGVSSPITAYHWHFGDGSSITTTGPTVTHVYGAPGTYDVRLRVTDAAGTSTAVVSTGQTVSRNGSARARAIHAVTIS